MPSAARSRRPSTCQDTLIRRPSCLRLAGQRRGPVSCRAGRHGAKAVGGGGGGSDRAGLALVVNPLAGPTGPTSCCCTGCGSRERSDFGPQGSPALERNQTPDRSRGRLPHCRHTRSVTAASASVEASAEAGADCGGRHCASGHVFVHKRDSMTRSRRDRGRARVKGVGYVPSLSVCRLAGVRNAKQGCRRRSVRAVPASAGARRRDVREVQLRLRAGRDRRGRASGRSRCRRRADGAGGHRRWR